MGVTGERQVPNPKAENLPRPTLARGIPPGILATGWTGMGLGMQGVRCVRRRGLAREAMTRSRKSARAAGSRFERQISDYLAEALDDDRIDRRAKTGAKDKGDIAGLRIHGQRIVIEAKDCARVALSAWIAEAHTEAANDDALLGIVVSKRHGVAEAGKQWVHMELADLVKLIRVAK